MEQRVAVVTGGAMGIGLAIVKRLVQDGFEVVVIDRSDDAAARVAEINAGSQRAHAIQADLSDVKAVPALAERILSERGRVDVLVNNAGTHLRSPKGERFDLVDVPLEAWEWTVAVHMTTPFLLTKAFLPGMKARRWGRIINIASRAGRTYTFTAGAHYHATKTGIIGLTRATAGEYAPYGITCNAIAPGRVDTALSQNSSDAVRTDALSELRVGRLGKPREIGAAVGFLVSEDAGFMTGAILDINGGGFFAP